MTTYRTVGKHVYRDHKLISIANTATAARELARKLDATENGFVPADDEPVITNPCRVFEIPAQGMVF